MGSRETATSQLGALVRRHRQDLGLTQEALAERSGRLSVDTIANIEQGRNRPYRQTLDALADALDLDAEARAALHAVRTGAAIAPASPSIRAPAPPVGLPPPPVPLTRLLGREHAKAAVARLLQEERERLVTLTGPGGVGKTRLALQVASDLANAFPDGVAWVDLAPLHDPTRVLPTLAHALGVRQDGGEPVADRLAARLQAARLLLALDNLEQVVEAGSALAALLAACPGVAVLATSRAALHVRGEREYPVTPLPVPRPAGERDLVTLAQEPAVALFLARGQAVRPDLALTATNAAAVVDICARLDGLPLALELAAARLALFSPQALLARLGRRLPMLVGGPRDLPVRQRTLQDAIAWSYDLLSPTAQALFRRLGVLSGGGTLEAIEALWPEADPAGAGSSVLDELTTLRDGSMVRLVEDADGEPRVMLLETLREYARERLADAGELAEVSRRHAVYYLAVAEASAPHMKGDAVGQAVRRLESERDNLHTALAWACTRGEAELAQRLAAALARYWYLTGQAVAGRQWLTTALALPGSVPARVRAAALERAGMLAHNMRDTLAEREYFEAALALYDALGDTAASRALQLTVDQLRIAQEETESPSERLARQSAVLEQERVRCERVGDTNGAAAAVLNIGRLLLLAGEREAAEPLLAESLALARRHGHLVVTVYALLHRGLAALQAGRLTAARAHYGDALRLAAEAGDRVMMTYGLEALVGLAALTGEAERAGRLAGAAAAARTALATPLAAEEQALYEGWISAAQAQAEPQEWEAAWNLGQAETLEDAVAAALEDLGRDDCVNETDM